MEESLICQDRAAVPRALAAAPRCLRLPREGPGPTWPCRISAFRRTVMGKGTDVVTNCSFFVRLSFSSQTSKY